MLYTAHMHNQPDSSVSKEAVHDRHTVNVTDFPLRTKFKMATGPTHSPTKFAQEVRYFPSLLLFYLMAFPVAKI